MAKKKEDLKDSVEDQEEEVDGEELEKALESALEVLNKAGKNKKAPRQDEEEDEDEEDDEEGNGFKYRKSHDEPDFEELSKSIMEQVVEDEEAEKVIDASPFIKSMVESLEGQLLEFMKAVVDLTDRTESVERRLRKSEKIEVAQAALVKSISQNVRGMAETPQPLRTDLGRNFTVLRKSGEGKTKKVELSKAQAMTKLTELHQAGKISLKDAVSLESRIQNGAELPENVTELLTAQ